MKSVVVVGSGFAGVEAVKALSGYCGVLFECRWVTRSARLVFLPALPEVAGGRLERRDVEWRVEGFAKRKGFELIEAEVTLVEEGALRLSDGDRLEYDYLVLATGATPAFFNIPGAEEHSVPLYSVENALEVRRRAGNASRVAIVGAGLVGVEVAAELKHARPELEVTVIDMMPRPLMLLRNDRASRLVEEELRRLGVKLFMEARVTAVRERRVETTKGEVEADLVVWAAGLRANRPEISGVKVEFVKGGYISVDEYLRAAPRIYAVGDVACVRVEGCTSLKMVREAMRQAKTAASNIVAEARGLRLRGYKPLISDCFPLAGVTLGPGRGVLVVGHGFALRTGLVGWYKDWQRRRYAKMLAG